MIKPFHPGQLLKMISKEETKTVFLVVEAGMSIYKIRNLDTHSVTLYGKNFAEAEFEPTGQRIKQ